MLGSPAARYLENLGPTSQMTMMFALRTISRLLGDSKADIFTFPWEHLMPGDILSLRESLAKYSANTGNLYFNALRGVLKESVFLELLTPEEFDRLVKSIEYFSGPSIPSGTAPREKDVEKLVNLCLLDSEPRGARDALVIGMLLTCPVGRSDLSRLKYEYLEAIVVDRKRCYQVEYPSGLSFEMSSRVSDLADRWLEFRGRDPGYLITRIDALPRVVAVSPQTIYDILKFRCVEFGLPEIRPKDLRRLRSLELFREE